MAAAAILNFKNFNFAHVAVIGFKFLKSKMADTTSDIEPDYSYVTKN